MKTLLFILLSVMSSITLAQEASMFELMRFSSQASEPEYTEAEALEKSVVVVRGYIDSVTEGRSVARRGGSPNAIPIETALFKIEVSQVLKGDVDGEYVYFEYIRGGMPAEFYDAVKYEGEVVLYLAEIDWVPSNAVVTNSTNGLMREVDHLYMLFSEDLFYALNNDPTAVRKPIPPIPVPEWAPRDSEGRLLRDSPERAGATSRPMGVSE